MNTITIKCHRPGTVYQTPHFFALNKGENSGKPMHQPCQNCFVILVSTQDEVDILFWLTWGIWQSKLFHPYMNGSVIPFIRLQEYKGLVIRHRTLYSNATASCNKGISLLQDLSNAEIANKKQLQLIQHAKLSVYHKYIFTKL